MLLLSMNASNQRAKIHGGMWKSSFLVMRRSSSAEKRAPDSSAATSSFSSMLTFSMLAEGRKRSIHQYQRSSSSGSSKKRKRRKRRKESILPLHLPRSHLTLTSSSSSKSASSSSANADTHRNTNSKRANHSSSNSKQPVISTSCAEDLHRGLPLRAGLQGCRRRRILLASAIRVCTPVLQVAYPMPRKGLSDLSRRELGRAAGRGGGTIRLIILYLSMWSLLPATSLNGTVRVGLLKSLSFAAGVLQASIIVVERNLSSPTVLRFATFRGAPVWRREVPDLNP